MAAVRFPAELSDVYVFYNLENLCTSTNDGINNANIIDFSCFMIYTYRFQLQKKKPTSSITLFDSLFAKF